MPPEETKKVVKKKRASKKKKAVKKSTKKAAKKKVSRKKKDEVVIPTNTIETPKDMLREPLPFIDRSFRSLKKTPKKQTHDNIAKSVSTASVIMVVLVIAISPSSAWILGPVIGAMAIFGIALGYFASK